MIAKNSEEAMFARSKKYAVDDLKNETNRIVVRW